MSSWPQNGHDGAASNADPVESALSPVTVADAASLRTIRAAGTFCAGGRARVGPPLLDDHHVYAFDGRSLVSYDADSGQRDWVTALPDAQFEQTELLAVSRGLVVVATDDCDTSDPVGTVTAYRTTDGSPAWTLHLPAQDGFSSAHLSGRYLVVATNEFEAGEFEVSVFRVQDGRLMWTRNTTADGVVDTASVVVAGNVISPVVRADGTFGLTAFALATGARVWTAGSAGALDAVQRGDSDMAGGSHLYVASAGTVHDVDPATGAPRFALAGATRAYAVDRTRVYALCTSSTRFCAYDRQTGALRYSYPVDGVPRAAVVAGGVLYLDLGRPLRTSTGVALDAATGRVLRRLAGTPTAVGQGRLAVLLRNGNLALYGLPGA